MHSSETKIDIKFRPLVEACWIIYNVAQCFLHISFNKGTTPLSIKKYDNYIGPLTYSSFSRLDFYRIYIYISYRPKRYRDGRPLLSTIQKYKNRRQTISNQTKHICRYKTKTHVDCLNMDDRSRRILPFTRFSCTYVLYVWNSLHDIYISIYR